jgi:cyclopropane fatty-acyl-phospholipid synthase-like methyltransferase
MPGARRAERAEPVPARHVRRACRFRRADMNAMPDTLGQFDFVWSACAFEHLGSIRQGRAGSS